MPSQRDQRIEACPWCKLDGEELAIRCGTSNELVGMRRTFNVVSSCGSAGPHRETRAEAIEAWNRIASSAQRPVEAKDAEGLARRYGDLIREDTAPTLDESHARALSRLVQEAVEAERDRILFRLRAECEHATPPLNSEQAHFRGGIVHSIAAVEAIRARREGEGEDAAVR